MEFFKQTNRITNKWTKTTAEAFGNTPAVRRGRAGELLIIDALRSWGWEVVDHERNRAKQVKHIDIEFRSPTWAHFYSGSIKSNMDDDQNIFVYDEWIHDTNTDRIFHSNPTTGWFCWYDTTNMKSFFRYNKDNIKTSGNGRRYLKVTPYMGSRWIKYRKHGEGYAY